MRIKTLTLNNFRAFPGPEPQTFDLDSKNLLIYGENGSGKSSIFHALKTFFTLNHPNYLGVACNVFSGLNDHWIEVQFDDGQLPLRWTGPPIGSAWTPDLRVTQAALRRGCLDYRAILDTNYGHGDRKINLFDIAVNVLLADQSESALGRTAPIVEWWTNVLNARPRRHDSRSLSQVNTACAGFNMAFESALAAMELRIEFLMQMLPLDGMQLDNLNFSGVTYNPTTRKFDGMVLEPEIRLSGYSVIYPQHFINEARLSALGLAIYLAGRLTCTPTGGTYLKLLVLDDVLIGIDLSNRLPLLDLLRKYFDDWQIVLLTHDRVWFEMARLYTQTSNKWKSVEIFDGICPIRNIPSPIIRKANDKAAKGLLTDAQRFLDENYSAAAANYARSAFELTLKMCCQRFSVPVSYNTDPRKVDTEDFLNALEAWFKNQGKRSFLEESIERVKMFRKVVLNQGSHSTPPTIAKSEISGAIYAVESLYKLTEPRADRDARSLVEARTLAGGSTLEEWVASLGYIRAAFAVSLRYFCKKKRVSVTFDDRSVRTLWGAVCATSRTLLINLPNFQTQVDSDRMWLIDDISDAEIQMLTQIELRRLLNILDPNMTDKVVLDNV